MNDPSYDIEIGMLQLGRTACLAYKGARLEGARLESIYATAAVLIALMYQPVDAEEQE